MWDETRYEGNIVYNWGNQDAQEVTFMAWLALANLAHMSGHSSTFVAEDDLAGCEDVESWDCDESMWWNNGIEIKGDSPPRLGFYHEYVVENVPSFNEMTAEEIEDKKVFQISSSDGK